MAVSVAYNNSGSAFTPTVGTEATLFTSSAAATYTFHVSTENMAAGDALELRVYQTILSGGTQHVVYKATFTDAQPSDDIVKISVPISDEQTSGSPLVFTLKQTAGTARAFPVKILKYA